MSLTLWLYKHLVANFVYIKVLRRPLAPKSANSGSRRPRSLGKPGTRRRRTAPSCKRRTSRPSSRSSRAPNFSRRATRRTRRSRRSTTRCSASYLRAFATTTRRSAPNWRNTVHLLRLPRYAFSNNLFSRLEFLIPPTFFFVAQASLRRARWMHEAGRLEHNEILLNYLETTYLAPEFVPRLYHVLVATDRCFLAAGRRRTTTSATTTTRPTSSRSRRETPATGPARAAFSSFFLELCSASDAFRNSGLIYRTYTCKSFSQALTLGTKYIYQAMPRMLTIWLEIGEHESVLRVSKEKKTQ